MAEKKNDESKKKDSYVKKKKDMNFQSVESMQSVVNVVNEAAAALMIRTVPSEKVQYPKCWLEHWELASVA